MTQSASFLATGASAKALSYAVSAAFCVLIGFQAWQLWQSQQDAAAPAIATAAVTPPPTPRRNDIRLLAASHLFGDVQVAAPQYTEVKEDKSLQLTLRGIVANRGGSTSLAIIQSSPNNEETFAVGDNVFNKGRLDHVAEDHVILARSNGQLARLQLPEQEIEGVGGGEEFLPLAQPDYTESAIDDSASVSQTMETDPSANQAVSLPAEDPENSAIQPEEAHDTEPLGTDPVP